MVTPFRVYTQFCTTSDFLKKSNLNTHEQKLLFITVEELPAHVIISWLKPAACGKEFAVAMLLLCGC